MAARFPSPRRSLRAFVMASSLFLLASPLIAQNTPAGTLRATVVDPSGAVIVGATITVTSADRPDSPPVTAQTTDAGFAAIPALLPGRYTIHAEFPGFEPRLVKDVRIRSGENRQSIELSISRLEASVNVEQDRQAGAADPRGSSFGATLTRDQIEALSDDPAQLAQQLRDMAGPGVVIRVDSFEGGALPAKAQIRSIRISRDQFAAEFHTAGGVSIEIITQPGLGPVRSYLFSSMRDGSLNARSPFVPSKGPEQNMDFGFGAGGSLIKNKSSFNLNVFGINSYETPNLNAVLAGGSKSEALRLHSDRDNLYVNGQVDYALTIDQTLRFAYNLTRNTNGNLGVGGYEQPEHAFSTENRIHNIRVQHFGPIGRRAFSRTRAQVIWSDTDSRSATDAVTVRVNDAFTSGGAQIAGGDHARTLSLGSDLDYVRGKHSWRGGILVEGGWRHSDSTSNYLGTYVFESLDQFLAGHPSNYSRRIGDARLAYRNLQAGVYLQDDIRVTKNFTLSPGIRYEMQTHVGDRADLGPRFGVTWAPFKGGQTTLRASAGVFNDWLPSQTYEQALRVDGTRQQELNILNPAYPDPGDVGLVPPINRYMLGNGYQAPRISRTSYGIDQSVLKATRLSATYSYQRGSRVSRGLNLNPPTGGLRPNAAFANIVDVVSDAESRQHQFQFDANVNPGAMLPAFNGPRVKWKRTTLFVNYTLAKLRNNTDGPFAIPSTGDLDVEWGPAANDVRHRLNATLNNQIIRNLMVSANVNASTGPAYTLFTGRDENLDGVFNDRPADVGRNSLRATGQSTINVWVAYQFAFGHMAPLPPGIGVFGGGNAAQVRTFDQGTKRYRLQVYVSAQNLANRANYLGYSGTQTSPFFGRPTTVSGMRKIESGFSLNF
jgi:Carboxypeptidase regulatory-like domain